VSRGEHFHRSGRGIKKKRKRSPADRAVSSDRVLLVAQFSLGTPSDWLGIISPIAFQLLVVRRAASGWTEL